MPFGAGETLATHEVLSEKINMINHFALYVQQCQDQELRGIIDRQLHTAVQSYNSMVSYTHDYRQSPDQIKYGLRNPAGESPQMNMQHLNDQQIAGATLSFHKRSAKDHLAGALECADPHIRQMMINGAISCTNDAYEVFSLMNRRGWYQVPTMDSHTAKTMLHHYQPVQGQMNHPGHPTAPGTTGSAGTMGNMGTTGAGTTGNWGQYQ